MTPRTLHGCPAAGGIAVGRALVLADDADAGGPPEAGRALAALAQVSAELERAAELLHEAGREEEAEIVESSRLMAEDPSFAAAVRDLGATRSPAQALREAGERLAAPLAALEDATLSARAVDVRRVAARAARIAAGAPPLRAGDDPVVVVAFDLGPADLAELELSGVELCGIALAEGAATSHAAIVARSLGVPMVVGLGADALTAPEGGLLVLNGDEGVLELEPNAETAARAAAAAERLARRRAALAATRGLPAETLDGRRVTLLCNVATRADAGAGISAGAAGAGLVRTELAFLAATSWPSESQHAAALAPVLAPLAGRTATVRVLDFGADKTPPFLAGEPRRGIELLLDHEDALEAQLRAVLRAAADVRLRILVPLVGAPEQVRAVRALLREAATATGWEGPLPALGAMVETPEAARRAAELALEADFLSIGTNDLVQYTLGLDRELSLASALTAAEPAVLRLVAAVTDAARAAGIPVEVCGEAAGEPLLAALLVGLGVDELSVAPARVDEIRATVRGLRYADAVVAAAEVVSFASSDAVLARARALTSLGEPGDERGEAVDRARGVLA